MSGATELTLLLIEDSTELHGGTAESLAGHGAAVTRMSDVTKGVREALRCIHDAVILDLGVLLLDGVATCRLLREHSDVPLVVLAPAGSDEADAVAALEAGADDVVRKPFSTIDLIARLRAAVRRARRGAGPPTVLRAGPLELFTASGKATLDGRPLDVTSYEFAILRVLAERRGRVLTREQILDYAKGGSENAFERSIDVRISRLRRKLSESSRKPSIIRTVRGIGYLLTSE